MTEADLVAALDETRALALALIERLREKFLPGSYVKALDDTDVQKIFEKQKDMIQRFQKERRDAATRLVLPPGASA